MVEKKNTAEKREKSELEIMDRFVTFCFYYPHPIQTNAMDFLSCRVLGSHRFAGLYKDRYLRSEFDCILNLIFGIFITLVG